MNSYEYRDNLGNPRDYYDIVNDATKLCEEIEEKDKEIERLNNIIDEARKYLTSYESIETIQQCEHPESNKGFDEKTMIEMCRRYLIVHDKLLDILELKEDK